MGTFLLDESSYYTGNSSGSLGNSTGDNPEGCIVSSVVSSFGLTPVYSAVELSVESPDLASPCAIIVTGGVSTGISSMDEPDAIIKVFFKNEIPYSVTERRAERVYAHFHKKRNRSSNHPLVAVFHNAHEENAEVWCSGGHMRFMDNLDFCAAMLSEVVEDGNRSKE